MSKGYLYFQHRLYFGTFTFFGVSGSRTAHKMIAYFEEEAVRSYESYLTMIAHGEVENVPHQLAIDYYNQKKDAKLYDMVYFERKMNLNMRKPTL